MHIASIPLALVLCAGTVLAEDVVVVHSGNGVASVSEDQLKDLFLGKKSSWEDGSKVMVVMVKEGASTKSLMKRLGKSVQQFQTGWKKLVFTGKGSMPEQVDNDAAVVDLVAKSPGAIAIVDKGAVKDGVKSIALP